MAEKNDYVNRELSWIEFNYRVLSEARDKSTPLFDRLKFLSITASNLDEFYMVRVASLKDMVHAKYAKKDIAGLTAKEQLDKISEKTHQLVDLQYSTYNRSLVPALKQNGLRIVMEHEDLTEDEAAFADEYFHKNVYPVLTPMAFDSSRPFPLIRNKTLNIAALLKKKNEKEAELEFAMVQVPSVIPRIVELPEEKDENGETQRVVILLEEIIERNMQSLFLNYDIVASHPFRIMRNADFSLDEEEAVDLLEEIQKQLKKRQWGEAIRLEIESNVDKQLLKILKKELSISSEDIFQISGPLDLTFLMKMYGLDGFDHLKTPKYTPQPVPELMNEDNIFTNIRKGDILLHHPYQSFDPVVNFVRSAARDPEVLAIKQTLYRVSGNSPIIAALAEAASGSSDGKVLKDFICNSDNLKKISGLEKYCQYGGIPDAEKVVKAALAYRLTEETSVTASPAASETPVPTSTTAATAIPYGNTSQQPDISATTEPDVKETETPQETAEPVNNLSATSVPTETPAAEASSSPDAASEEPTDDINISVKNSLYKGYARKINVTVGGSISEIKYSKGKKETSYFGKFGNEFTNVNSSSFTIKAYEPGWYTIYVKTIGGKEKIKNVFANVKIVKISKTKLSIKKGTEYKLTASIKEQSSYPEKLTGKVYFKTSNKKIVSVNAATGKIKAKSKGRAVITAYTKNGKSAKCTVTCK